MDFKVQVQGKIQKPVAEVFDAVYNPKKLAGYFITAGGSGPLDEGKTVMWEFADFPGPFPVIVKQCVKNEKIVFEWEANDGEGKPAGYNTRVEMNFTALDSNSTMVQISESGWRQEEASWKASTGNGQGWMHMLCCMKAYVEYGINLRKGFL